MMTKNRLFVVVMMAAMMCGCRTERAVTVVGVRTDTLLITKTLRDSILIHDSVHVREYARNDTVYVEVDRLVERVRDRLLRDTIYKSHTDSIPVPYPVERQLTRWERTRLDWGGWAMAACGILIMVLLFTFYHKVSSL